ncbi:DUF938 domain-containing protein [Chitinivorax sp. B]|uniref:DUF938 domain-containing protein n=1 Tax=Chitinivorax sp. B TaxID=2502235 RepID=UPI0010F7215C|nr:DUF938 domain-containing protein [Chitinivorax sp. B]
MTKPYSDACVRNQDAILAIIRRHLHTTGIVLEIGSGTGQHAVHFGRALSFLTWQTSDLADKHAGIQRWLGEAKLSNVLPPLVLDADGDWPSLTIDHAYTANTFHIMSWLQVCATLNKLGKLLPVNGLLFVYGPFNYNGCFTSASNAEFDHWLRTERGSHCGIRDAEAVIAHAATSGLTWVEDNVMPANNHMLVFRRVSP